MVKTQVRCSDRAVRYVRCMDRFYKEGLSLAGVHPDYYLIVGVPVKT
jgi:hypothetical protein